MRYLSELPEISSVGTDGDEFELELEEEVIQLPDLGQHEPNVLVATYAGQLVVTVGQVLEHETLEGPPGNKWSRIIIKGRMVQFST